MLWQQQLPLLLMVALLLRLLVAVGLHNSWNCCCKSSWLGWLNCSGLWSCLPTRRALLLLASGGCKPQQHARPQSVTLAPAAVGRAAVCMMLLQV